MVTVLIIDGDPMVRLTAAGVLANAGCLVLCVHSRQDTFRYLSSIKADLAICDITEKEILRDICSADPEISVLNMIRKDEPLFRADSNITRSESHSRQANSSTLFAVVSPGGGRSDVFDMEVFLASRRLSARSARHRCWSALERFDLRAFASVPAMPSKKNGISPEIGDEENRATIVAAPP